MIKSIKTIMRQDREPYRIPRRVQDVIPIQCLWPDGIFKVGIKFSKLAIVRANRYMVDNSDFLIAYAWHPGNARELVEYAQRRERRGLLRVNVLGQA